MHDSWKLHKSNVLRLQLHDLELAKQQNRLDVRKSVRSPRGLDKLIASLYVAIWGVPWMAISPLAKHTNPEMFFTAMFFNGNVTYMVSQKMPDANLYTLGNFHFQAI